MQRCRKLTAPTRTSIWPIMTTHRRPKISLSAPAMAKETAAPMDQPPGIHAISSRPSSDMPIWAMICEGITKPDAIAGTNERPRNCQQLARSYCQQLPETYKHCQYSRESDLWRCFLTLGLLESFGVHRFGLARLGHSWYKMQENSE
jgi:hypothetical protein